LRNSKSFWSETDLRGRLLVLAGACLIGACSAGSEEHGSPVKVEVVATATGHQLVRGGEPYTIRGAGMSVDHIEAFVAHGGNSIRNWTTDDAPQDIRELLDEAHANGVTVMLCLPMQAERWGFDYDDTEAVAAQLDAFRRVVIEYRDHPALLAWIIGNELNHGYTNPRVYDAVNDVAEMIHELDPYHPATTTIAGFSAGVVADILARAPALDFISVQAYGMLFALPELFEESGFDHPFMVTEWGAIGYWEVERTDWGAPIEATSSQKADVFRRAHEEVLGRLGGQLLGSYVFYWGQKQERTPTWFGLLTEAGEETEAVDVMHHIWRGTWPANRAPQLRSMHLDGREPRSSVRLSPGDRVAARVEVTDPDGDPLTYRWELKPESEATQVGGDHEVSISSLGGFIEGGGAAEVRVTAPAPGAYRLFAYAYDGQGHAAHANFPFLVESGARP
jgi:hypothetical protein